MTYPAPIQNGCDVPLNIQTGTIPQVDGTLMDWFQQLFFIPIKKSTEAFQVVEQGAPFYFRGLLMPLSGKQLQLKPEGERAWNWISIYAQTVLPLNTDDCILFIGKQYRVMSQKNYTLYGYFEYQLVSDWTGSGPSL